MYICCRKYYKSSEVTDSYNSSDVVRDLVAALQNYSQSPDTCKSLNEGPVMYDRCIRHFSDTFSLKCHSFLLWQAAMHCIFECLINGTNVYGMDSRQILEFFVYFTVDTEMMKQLHLDLRVSNISIKMMKDMMHVTLTSPGSVSSGFSRYQIVFQISSV